MATTAHLGPGRRVVVVLSAIALAVMPICDTWFESNTDLAEDRRFLIANNRQSIRGVDVDRSVLPGIAIGMRNGDGAANADQSVFAPPPNGRGRMMLYAVLIVLILAVNAIVFVVGMSSAWRTDHAVSLQVIAAIAQANLLIAILHRQQWLVSLVGFRATNAPKSLPLAIRWRLAQYYHFGGAHIGAAISGTLW